MNINIGNLSAGRAFLSPNLEACIGEEYRYSFKEMNRRVNQFASFLEASGISKGDRIAVLAKNNEEVLTVLFGAAKIGVITAVLNYRLAPPELAYILNNCRAKLLVYGYEFKQTVSALKSLVSVKDYVSTGDAGDDKIFAGILEGMDEKEPEISAYGEDPAVLMYTSGTMGKPKGVVLTHENCFRAAIGLVHSLDWAYKYKYLAVAPLFHIGGLAPVFANVHIGCPMVFMPDFDPVKAWEIIEKEKINFAMTVPVMLKYMAMIPGVENKDLTGLRHFICGGAPVPKSLIELYEKKGINVYQVYGATEYTGAISFWTKDMGMEKADSAGKMVFHGDAKIMDPSTGAELGTNETGEICLFGPQVFKGYWENQKATESVLVNGYYRTGDLGKKDGEGCLYVVDRLKDMIISGGENIYPAEIESVLINDPNIADVAVVGKMDEEWGEVPAAFIVKAENGEMDESGVERICRENLAGYKCVKEIRFISEIPRNSLGKVLKRNLRDIL